MTCHEVAGIRRTLFEILIRAHSCPFVVSVNLSHYPVERQIDGVREQEYGALVMEAIAETLEAKLHEWKPETAQKVRALVAEIIELADEDALDIGRSRSVEQEVLDILDEPSAR